MGYPHPYFVGKILFFLSLQVWLRCRISTTKKFPAKYYSERSYVQFKKDLNKLLGNFSISSGLEHFPYYCRPSMQCLNHADAFSGVI